MIGPRRRYSSVTRSNQHFSDTGRWLHSAHRLAHHEEEVLQPTARYTPSIMKSIIFIAAALASVDAFKAVPVVPSKVPVPSSADAALALRGGGVVSPDVWLKAFTAFFGMYAVGFVLAPAMVIEQNFDAPYDKYHLFISRLSGVSFLTLICKPTVAPPSSQVSSIPNSPTSAFPFVSRPPLRVCAFPVPHDLRGQMCSM